MDYSGNVNLAYDGIILKDMEEFKDTLQYLANSAPYEGRVEMQRQEGDNDASPDAVNAAIQDAYERALDTPLNNEEFAYDFFRSAAGSNLYRTTVFLHSREGQLVMRVEPEYAGGYDEGQIAKELGLERGVYAINVNAPIETTDGSFVVDVSALAERTGLGQDNLESIVNQVMTTEKAKGQYTPSGDEEIISYDLSAFPVDLYFRIQGNKGSLERNGNVISGQGDNPSLVLSIIPYIDSRIEDPVAVPNEQKELMEYANSALKWLSERY